MERTIKSLHRKLIDREAVPNESTETKNTVGSKLATVEKIIQESPTNSKEIVNCWIRTDARVVQSN